MRHIFLRTLLLPLALLAFSCRKGVEKADGDVTLTLRINMADTPQTKVTVPGDNGRHENLIKWVDLFLFSGEGGSGTEVMRTPYQKIIPVRDDVDSTLYTATLHLSNTRLQQLFGTEDPGAGNSRTAKIVVVGNGDAVSAGNYMVYPSDATSSIQSVRESVAKTNFDAWYAENLSYLIMCGSGDITLEHTVSPDEVTLTGTIPMTRAYSKLDIALDLPPLGQLEFSGRTYQANLDSLKIELLNVVSRGYAGGDESHVMTCTSGDFLPTTNTRAMRASGNPLTATHNCFYSYPRRFSDVPENKTEYRISIQWQATDADPGDPVHIGYYRFPVADEENETAIYANHYYHSEAAIHTLGSANPAAPETLEGSWSILPWEATPVYGKFNDYQYLIAHPTFVPMHGLTIGIAEYKSSSPLTSYAITSVVTYGVTTEGEESSRTITNPTDLARYSVTHDAEANTVTLNHELELEGGDMFYRQEITVTLQNSNGLDEVIVFEQTPPIEVRSTGHRGGTDNFFIDGFKMGEGTSLNSSDPCRPPDANSTMALVYNLRFTVSSFASDNNTYIYGSPTANPLVHHEYIIGDPRVLVPSGRFTTTDFNKTGSYTWDQTTLDKIFIANSAASGADYIAPEFITCTGYARAPKMSLANLEKRAAMYQESGYPAGRWRLMTEAEYKFLVNLQIQGKIPKFFYDDSDSPYYTAQGTCFEINTDGISYRMVTPAPSTAYARFVYDTWYWGPEPDPGHITSYLPQP